MLLAQDRYPDEDGKTVEADQIEAVGTFKYSVDGFFEWECPHCCGRASNQAFAINGVVFTCEKCKKCVLLLRSDARFVSGILPDCTQPRPATDNLIQNILKHLGQVITSRGRDRRRRRGTN